MSYEIKIYGEIISTYAKHSGSKGVCLEDVQSQLNMADGQDIKVRINSVGGDCQEGFAIYDELRRYARNNKAQIHTFAESNLASVATIFFLAGDVREVSRTLEPFVHNAQWDIQGDAKAMTEAAAILERWNDKIAKHYSEHTDLTYKEARALMNSDTFITPEEAKAMRFATKVERVTRPAALQRFNINRTDKMNKNKKSILDKISDILKGAGVENKKVMSADQREVDFYELEEDEPIEVGANATIDGAPAEGEVVMPDGETYVFAAGVLTEKRPKEDAPQENEMEAELNALRAENESLKSANASLTAKVGEQKETIKNHKLAIHNFKNLESQFVETPPASRPARTPDVEAKGSRFAKAMNTFETLNKK